MLALRLSGKLVELQNGYYGAYSIRVVFVIMLISSLAFYIMAFRVPVVSTAAIDLYCEANSN